jgi:hypothetical protein
MEINPNRVTGWTLLISALGWAVMLAATHKLWEHTQKQDRTPAVVRAQDTCKKVADLLAQSNPNFEGAKSVWPVIVGKVWSEYWIARAIGISTYMPLEWWLWMASSKEVSEVLEQDMNSWLAWCAFDLDQIQTLRLVEKGNTSDHLAHILNSRWANVTQFVPFTDNSQSEKTKKE